MGELTQRLRTSGDWRFCDSRHRDELAAAELLESQAAELATLQRQNANQAKTIDQYMLEIAEQAKRIGELEEMRVEIDDQNRMLCENNRKQSVSLGALIADTDEQRKERDTLRSELAELRGTAEVAKKHLETAFAEDIDLAEGTANIRLALQALAASGEG